MYFFRAYINRKLQCARHAVKKREAIQSPRLVRLFACEKQYICKVTSSPEKAASEPLAESRIDGANLLALGRSEAMA